MPLKNDWQNGDLFTPAAANDMANVVNAFGPPTATGQAVVTAANTGAARAAISAERQRVYNVKDYGAVGDGVANDRAAIHSARDAAGVGGTLYFPPGTYKVEMLSNSATGYKFGCGGLHANVAGQTWDLGSAELVLTGSQADNLITIDATNVSILGGTLNLSAIAGAYFFNAGIAVWSGTLFGASFGTHSSNSAGAVIRDVTINEASSMGVWVIGTSQVTVTGCTIKDFYQAGILVVTSVGLNIPIYDFVIEDNYVETDLLMQAAGIAVGGNDQSAANFEAGTSRLRRVRITNNRVTLPGRLFRIGGSPAVIDTGCIEMFNVDEAVVDGNITNGGGFGITTAYLRNVAYSNNTCRGFRIIGIEIGGGLDGVNVVGNMIDSDGAAGPFNDTTGVQDAAGSLGQVALGILGSGVSYWRNLTIAGNTITGFTTAARVGGISIAVDQGGATLENAVISGNNITAGGGSALFTAIAIGGPSTNVTITGNTVDGSSRTPTTAVDLVNNTHVGMSITGNSFSNFDKVTNLLGTLTDVRFTGNLIRNCATIISGSGVASATRLVVDNGAPFTSTATAAGTTTLTETATEIQIFTGSTTQIVKLPTTSVVTARQFTVINSSTGDVAVQSSSGAAIETVRAGTSYTFVALQNAPTAAEHWNVIASGQGSTLNRLQPQSLSNRANLVATGPDSTIAVNMICKGESALRLQSDTGYALEAFPVASTANNLQVYSATAGNTPYIIPAGTDAAINLNLRTKSTGVVQANGVEVSTNSTTVTHTAQQIELGHATDTTLSRSAAGKIAVEGVDVLLSGGALGTPSSGTLTNATGLPVSGITASTSAALGVGSIELGHASDTTIARSSAGVVSVEGVPLVTTTGTATLSNKSLSTPNIDGGAGTAVISTTSSATDASLYVNAKGAGSVRLAATASEAFWAVPIASGVNYLKANAATTGNAPQLQVAGTDPNISLNLRTVGTGVVQANGVAVSLNATTATHTVQQIELGHATDTTITRTAAGVPAVEGNPLGVRVGVPASAAATGAVGQFSTDASWLYVCTATDTWMRTAIATW
jgi:hypothetical protein